MGKYSCLFCFKNCDLLLDGIFADSGYLEVQTRDSEQANSVESQKT